MPRFMRVIGNGCHLQWPVPPFSEEQRSRGGEGYIVDADHPLEKGYDVPETDKYGEPVFGDDGKPKMKHIAGWLEGQMHKLAPAPSAKAATPIDVPLARAKILEYEAANAPKSEQPPAPKEGGKTKNWQKPAREPVEVIEGG